jgi:hypothetical protein
MKQQAWRMTAYWFVSVMAVVKGDSVLTTSRVDFARLSLRTLYNFCLLINETSGLGFTSEDHWKARGMQARRLRVFISIQ